jgi:hypothetical protein
MSFFVRQMIVVAAWMAIAAPQARAQAGPATASADTTPIQVQAAPPAAPPAARADVAAAAKGTRHALIVCGLAGDAAHRTLFGETITTLHTALTTRHAFAPDSITVIASDALAENEGASMMVNRGPATREALAEAAAALAGAVQPQDALWVFVLGHAHYDGKNSCLNLPGPDLNQAEFGKLFADLQCAEQVFFMTTAASGFFVRPLSKTGRIVIAATEADREVNETIFPHKLAAALAEPLPEFDIDGDGRLSLLDVYLRAARETAQEYASGMLLATEHAQIDDNGDGRGTELQAAFLPEDLGGRLTAGQTTPAVITGDGAAARQVILTSPPSPDGRAEP